MSGPELPVALILGALVLMIWVKRPGSRSAAREPTFVPDPANDKTIMVRGFAGADLEKIIEDFRGAYGIPSSFRIASFEVDPDTFRVSFPDDIGTLPFLFLVNFLRYPKGINTVGRTIGVLGRSTLTSQFNLPRPALLGKRAEFYVPDKDKKYDTVFIRVDDGSVYRNSFAASKWKEVRDARVPKAIESL